MFGFFAHMPTNGKSEKSNLTISYKATFTYSISRENMQVLKFSSYFDIYISFKNNIWTHELCQAPLLHNSLLIKNVVQEAKSTWLLISAYLDIKTFWVSIPH